MATPDRRLELRTHPTNSYRYKARKIDNFLMALDLLREHGNGSERAPQAVEISQNGLGDPRLASPSLAPDRSNAESSVALACCLARGA
jgi:hypothetical protein